MKKKLLQLNLLLFFLFSCRVTQFGKISSKFLGREVLQSDFIKYFNILDSAAIVQNDSLVFGCTNAISFMEDVTKLSAKSDGTYFGKMYCSKNEIFLWHLWYQENYKKIHP
jgi:hypothetical protein